MASFHPLQHPFTMVIAGPSGSGKTPWVTQLCETANQMIVPTPKHTVWHYGIYQNEYALLQNTLRKDSQTTTTISFIQAHDCFLAGDGNAVAATDTLYIFDDVMFDVGKNSEFAKLFTQGRHHKGISIVFLINNLFFQDKVMRIIHLNTQFLVLLKSPRDVGQVQVLGRQLFGPKNAPYFVDAYHQAISKQPFGHLFVDMKPITPQPLQLSTNLFGKEQPTTYFVVPKVLLEYGTHRFDIIYNKDHLPTVTV